MTTRGDDPAADASLATESAYSPTVVAARGSALGLRGVLARAGELPRSPSTLVWLIPLTIAAAYLVVFVVQLPHNIVASAWDADYASGFTVPETLAKTGTDGNMVLGSAGQWVPLWFGLLTASLPLHRELWGVAPTLLFVMTALIVGWSVSQVANRRAGVLAVLIGLVASPLALTFFMAAVAHNTVYPCTALLGAYLIWLARGDGRRRLTAVVVPLLAGVAIGTCLASDLLLAATAVVPLAFTALLAGARRERRSRLLALSALVTVAVSIPTAVITSSIMHSLGFRTLETPAKVVPVGELPQRAELLFKGLKALFNGYLGPASPGTLHSELGIASVVVMSAALLTLVGLGITTAVRFMWSGLRKRGAVPPTQLARSVHVIYWVSSAAAACGSFWLAGETGGNANLHESYYATTIFSVAAIVPLLLATRSRVRWLIPAGAAIFFLASLVGLTSFNMDLYPWVAKSESAVTKIARANHVTVGYGGYLVASTLTWNTDGRVQVRPLIECENPTGASICPFYMESVPSWYVPQQRHTFLLTSSEEPWISSLPRGLGRPLAAYSLGTVRMYIYPYDIASRLGPEPD